MPFRCVALPVLRSQVDTPFSYCLFSFLIAFVYVQGLYVDLVEEKQGVYLYDQDTQDGCSLALCTFPCWTSLCFTYSPLP